MDSLRRIIGNRFVALSAIVLILFVIFFTILGAITVSDGTEGSLVAGVVIMAGAVLVAILVIIALISYWSQQSTAKNLGADNAPTPASPLKIVLGLILSGAFGYITAVAFLPMLYGALRSMSPTETTLSDLLIILIILIPISATFGVIHFCTKLILPTKSKGIQRTSFGVISAVLIIFSIVYFIMVTKNGG